MNKTGTVPILVYIITRKEIRRIKRALASVAGWVDEIAVVGSGSDDGTLDVVRKFTDWVYHRDFEGFGQQYAYAHGLTDLPPVTEPVSKLVRGIGFTLSFRTPR